MPADPVSAPPLVAVVTPVYNGAEFLAEAMESVQAQTYPNIVHVVLDNASTDATPEIIERFRGRKVPLVTGRNHTLLEVVHNWNAALELLPAEAAYFQFLCADDTLLPEATRRATLLAESDPRITVVTTGLYYNNDYYDFGWPRDRSVFDGDEALRRYFVNEGPIEARQIFMRREAIDSAKPFFDAEVALACDIDAALRMLNRGRFGYIHEPLGRIRIHDESISHAVVQPQKIHFHNWLIMMRRHARGAFGKDYDDLEKRYLRFYFRRMLRWRLVGGDKRVFDLHMQLLEKIDSKPSMADFADAMLDFALEKLGLRPGWYSYPC